MRNLNSQKIWIGIAIIGVALSFGLYIMTTSGSPGYSSASGNLSERAQACVEMLNNLREGESVSTKGSSAGLEASMRNLRATYMDICN